MSKLCKHLIVSLVCCCAVPVKSQQIEEGGMKFYNRSVDSMSTRSGAVAGISLGGSASVRGGTINTGSSASDILSEMNPIALTSEGNLKSTVAGEARQWAQVLSLERDDKLELSGILPTSINMGTLNPNLKRLLTRQMSLVEKITKSNPILPSEPFENIQFTSEFEELESLIGSESTKGLHILYSGQARVLEPKGLKNSNNSNLKLWEENQIVDSVPVYMGYSPKTGSKNTNTDIVLRATSLETVGTTQNRSNFSVVGFAENPNPNFGKVSSISAFATNNRTVGTIRVPDVIDGEPATLQVIAQQYGTTVAELMQVNNLPSANSDITGLIITIPADLLTVDNYIIPDLPGSTRDTARTLAGRFGVSVSWIMELNGLVNADQELETGQNIQIPGLTKSCSSNPELVGCRNTALPPVKPLLPELETADYGSYAVKDVTYDCIGKLMNFCSRFLQPFR